ncbi:MAG TPA: hypothetical protein PKK00_05225 [Bacteroidales bacterium]|nr:hypothetical protein [Bacteroidales bacterium]HPS16759.1 hypothetical protein [Bacteroidales bacterium]
MIYPKRIVFDGSKRLQELNLSNIGKDTSTYIISIVQIRMKEDGGFENITQPDSGQYFADKYLRIFPHKVVLAPKETQVVKVQCINAEQIPTGEYRSHLYFKAVGQSNKPLGDEDASKDKDTNDITVSITPVFGITIPAIIRIGESTAQVSLSDVSLKMESDSLPILKMKFSRSGNMSVYGDVTVTYISPLEEETQVALAKGVAVYTPNTSRWFQLYLDKKIKYTKGKIHINYSTQDGVKLSEADILLQ